MENTLIELQKRRKHMADAVESLRAIELSQGASRPEIVVYEARLDEIESCIKLLTKHKS